MSALSATSMKPLRKKRTPSRAAAKAKTGATPKTAAGAPARWYKQFLIPAVITVLVTVTGALIIGYFKGELGKKPPMGASLEKPTVDTNVSLKEFLDARHFASAGYTQDKLEQVGYVVHFKVHIEGFKERTCTGLWEVFDAENRSKFFPPGWSKDQDPLEVIPEGDVDEAAENFWIPPVGTDRAFFVRVRIFDDKEVELVYGDSDPVKPYLPKPPESSPTNTNSAKPRPSKRK